MKLQVTHLIQILTMALLYSLATGSKFFYHTSIFSCLLLLFREKRNDLTSCLKGTFNKNRKLLFFCFLYTALLSIKVLKTINTDEGRMLLASLNQTVISIPVYFILFAILKTEFSSVKIASHVNKMAFFISISTVLYLIYSHQVFRSHVPLTSVVIYANLLIYFALFFKKKGEHIMYITLTLLSFILIQFSLEDSVEKNFIMIPTLLQLYLSGTYEYKLAKYIQISIYTILISVIILNIKHLDNHKMTISFASCVQKARLIDIPIGLTFAYIVKIISSTLRDKQFKFLIFSTALEAFALALTHANCIYSAAQQLIQMTILIYVTQKSDNFTLQNEHDA